MARAALVALTLAASVSALAADPHPCHAYPTKLAKIKACPTATQFCNDYLGPAGATFTKTIVTRTTVLRAEITKTETSTHTDTVTTNTITVAAPTSTVTVDSTKIITTSKFSCDSGSKIKRVGGAALKSKDCGIVTTTATDAISGACNCFLASSTTVASTITRGKAKTTTTTTTGTTAISVDGTTTTTPIETKTNTPTQVVCSPIPTFNLKITCAGCSKEGYYWQQGPASEGDVGLVSQVSDATVYYIEPETTYLRNVMDNLFVAAITYALSSLFTCQDLDNCDGGHSAALACTEVPSFPIDPNTQFHFYHPKGNNLVVLPQYNQLAISAGENDWAGFGGSAPVKVFFVPL